jgi:hypothetical protein
MSARGRPDADEAVERLVELAREAPAKDLTPREAAGLRRLERSLLVQRAPRSSRRTFQVVAAAALVAASVAVTLGLRDRAITYEVVNGTVSEGGYIATGDAEASLRFSDRSELGVAAGTRVRVSRLQVHGARVMLEGGTLHVRIHHEPGTAWTLDAGPYVVHVTGTEFDLGWRADEQTFDLRLHAGSVVVEGPLADAGVRVAAGQHLVANGQAGTLALVDELNAHAPSMEGAPPTSASTSPSGEPIAQVAAMQTDADTDAPRGAASRDTAAAPHGHTEAQGAKGWTARIARGDFDGVVADAERRGVERALAESSVADLAALADASRYARRQDLARRALMAQRARYPGSMQARDASFFLGGLAENQKDDAAAVAWYDGYLVENANGAYVPQALGRKMLLLQRLKGAASALPIASEYLARFPDGAYARAANKLLHAQ